jgi:hypothetical protein
MTDPAFDFSDIIFTTPATTPIPRLSGTDTAIIRWFERLLDSRDVGRLQVDAIAWFLGRLVIHGGVLVWLAQDGRLLDRGLCDLFAEASELVPEPWAGFLRWSGDRENLTCFESWEQYRSDDNWDPRPKIQPKRRR